MSAGLYGKASPAGERRWMSGCEEPPARQQSGLASAEDWVLRGFFRVFVARDVELMSVSLAEEGCLRCPQSTKLFESVPLVELLQTL